MDCYFAGATWIPVTGNVRSQRGITMPIEINYLDDGLGFSFVGKEILTGEEIISSNSQIFSAKEKLAKYRYALIDYTNITQFKVSSHEIEVIASQDKKASRHVPEGVIAIVAKKDIEFGVSRMWETIIEITGIKWETMVCRKREDAVAWIKKRVDEKFEISDLTFS